MSHVPAFPRSLWAREALMLVATLTGWLAGGVAFALFWSSPARPGGPGYGALQVDRGEQLLRFLAAGLYVSGFGCVWVFPSVLIWLAAFVRVDRAIARPFPAALFGLACGAAAAVAIWIPVGAGALVLDLESTLAFAAHGAIVGMVTWTAYVLLARSAGARRTPERRAIHPQASQADRGAPTRALSPDRRGWRS